MTTTNPTSNPFPAELVQAGKDAFAAGVQAADCPYPGGDLDCHADQKFRLERLWLLRPLRRFSRLENALLAAERADGVL
jgi:hypothetical protein